LETLIIIVPFNTGEIEAPKAEVVRRVLICISCDVEEEREVFKKIEVVEVS
jgi:hypothetical protein